MKAHWTLLVGGVAALLLAGGCQAAEGPVEKVVIGADLELTGPDAAIGNVYKQALLLKVEQINQSGVLGNRELSLRIRDSRSDPATAAADVAALAADPNVRALITGTCGDCVVGAAKAINDAKIPTISLAGQANVATPVAERKYIFKLAPNAADDAAVLVSELEQTGLKKIGVMGMQDSFSKEAVLAVSGSITRSGATALPTEWVTGDADQASQAATRLLRAKPDAIVAMAHGPVSAALAKGIRDAGFTGRILFGSGSADSLFLSPDASTVMNGAGLVFTPTLVSDDIIATSPAKASRVAWFRDYLSKYGTYGAFASFAADAVNMVSQAMVQTGSIDRDVLRSAVETTKMDGLSGPIQLTPNNHSGLMPQAVTLLVAANGRWRLAS